ncbi:MAG: ASCH domain-containing protein [Deltaproteobacteria bacterium]|nr:ASCH domain-containing protein [Deltaproteobacteria bacterium]
MKALSVRNPWAWLIVHGIKDVENRNWASNYRGQLLIHASMTWDYDGALWISNHFGKIFPNVSEVTQGAIIGRVNMVDCVTRHASKLFFGRYGFVLQEPKAFENPIPYRGQLGLFDVPEDILPF